MEVIFQFKKGNSFVHKLNPVTKVIVLFAISFLAFGSFMGLVQLIVLLASIIIALVFARLTISEMWRATKWLILACLSFFVIQAYMLKVPGQIALFNIGSKTIYFEVLDYSAAVSIRIFTIFLVSFIFIRTTHPRDLVVSFVQVFKIPYKIPYAFFIALRIIPLIEKEARTIREAHMVRGIGEKTSLKGRIENIKRFTIPLLIRSLRDASITSHSMESRGFGAYPKRTFVEEMYMTKVDKLISAIFIIAVIIWYILVFVGVIPFEYSLA